MGNRSLALASIPLMGCALLYLFSALKVPVGLLFMAIVLSTVIFLASLCVILRILAVLPSPHLKPVTAGEPVHLLAVFGSGGHTSEMMSLLRKMDVTRYMQRTYIYSSGDSFSKGKAEQLEEQLQSKQQSTIKQSGHLTPPEPTQSGQLSTTTGTWNAVCVRRARRIHQPLITAPLTSLLCFLDCLVVLYRSSSWGPLTTYPDVILVNGPATSVILVIASYALKFVGLAPRKKMKIIYVESFARVRTLSLSGRILLRLGLCDKFLVQWETLRDLLKTQGHDCVEWRDFLVD